MTFDRLTVADRDIVLEGEGLHSGAPVTLRFVPNQNGIRFIWNEQTIEAVPANVADTHRCTRLGPIATIEHAMAALAGCGITDVDVVLSAPELPALDGSALPYVRALRDAGPLQKIAEVERPSPFSRLFLHEGEAKLAISAGDGEWRYEFCCPGKWPEKQVFESVNIQAEFDDQVSPARTFGFEAEVPQIRAAGLAKGLDLEKALLIGSEGYANQARFPNEPARHKLLDAIGDLYLSGIPIHFLNVVAERTGHRMNIQAAHRLRQATHRT